MRRRSRSPGKRASSPSRTGASSAVRRLSPGDRVAYYAPKTDLDGAPVQAFVALAEVTGEAAVERPSPGHGPAWVRAARFRDVRETPVRPLLEQLSFVRDPRHWGMAFRQGKFAVSDADFAVIARAMGAAP